MVEITQGRSQCFLHISVRLILSQPGRQITTACSTIVVSGVSLMGEPVDPLLLLLIDAPAKCQLAAQIVVRAVAVKLV